MVTEPSPSGDLLPPAPVGRRRRRVALAVVAAAAVVATAAGGTLLLRDDGRDHPSAWDPRVAELTSFVERERGLDFDHPVFLEFLDPVEFESLLRVDESALTDDDRRDIEDSAAVLRALGLLGGDVDLFAEQNDLTGEGTLAYYDPTEERIRVRGTELTPALRVTLVHELTHALQDQHFDLSRIDSLDDSRSAMLHALAEGDANRVEAAYRETLDDAELEQADAARAADIDRVDLDRFPAVLTALFAAPYALGQPLASIIVEVDGQRGLDEAFEDPPAAEEALLDPLGYVDGDRPEAVPALTAGDSEEEIDSGEFGAYGLYIVLAHRLDARRALAVATGWGGDSYVAYRSSGRVCVRASFVGDDQAATSGLLTGLADWARAMPAGFATVESVDGRVALTSCEPAGAAVVPGDVTVDVLVGLPATRASIGLAVLRQGGAVGPARCYSAGVVDALTFDQLTSDEADAALAAKVQSIAAACRRA